MPAGVTEDIVGNPTPGASYTYQYQPTSGNYQTATAVSNAVFGGLAGATAAAAVGVTGVGGEQASPVAFDCPGAAAARPQAAASGAGILLERCLGKHKQQTMCMCAGALGSAAATGAATFVALHLLTFGQTFSMMGRLNIPNLPPQFRQVCPCKAVTCCLTQCCLHTCQQRTAALSCRVHRTQSASCSCQARKVLPWRI